MSPGPVAVEGSGEENADECTKEELLIPYDFVKNAGSRCSKAVDPGVGDDVHDPGGGQAEEHTQKPPREEADGSENGATNDTEQENFQAGRNVHGLLVDEHAGHCYT